MTPLSHLQAGQTATITALSRQNNPYRRKLLALGTHAPHVTVGGACRTHG